MRTLVIIPIVAAVLIGGAVLYLVSTTPETAVPVRLPLSPSQRALLAHVPAHADFFALIPTAARLHEVLLANPATMEPVLQWTHDHEMPSPWMLGGASVAVWKVGKKTSYAVRLDPFRALLLRVSLLVTSTADARWEGATLIMHDPVPPPRTIDLDPLLRLAHGLPEGDVLAVQLESARGAFPPIGRPAVSSVRVTPTEITIVSRAATTDAGEQREIRPRFPRSAILAAAFASPPRILGDLSRLVGTRVDALVDDGGSIALYGVETGGLLPRPRGVIVIPADEEGRRQFEEIRPYAELVGQTHDAGDRLVVSFDRTSLPLYIKDTPVPSAWPATRWAMRIDPARLLPILRKVGDSHGLRFASPRISRAARDLRSWIDVLEHVGSIEAAAAVSGGVEELRVRVASK